MKILTADFAGRTGRLHELTASDPRWDRMVDASEIEWFSRMDDEARWRRDADDSNKGADVNINGAFPSNYLKAADLQGRRVPVTIANVTMEDIGGDYKPVVKFQGKDKGMVLNKTNANMIAEISGSEETDEWSGVQIMLYPTKTDFQGKRVDAIRVDYPTAKAKPDPPPDMDSVPF